MDQSERILVVWTIPEREGLAGQWGRVAGQAALAGGGQTERIELEGGQTTYGCECFTVPEASAQAAESVGVDIPTMVARAAPTYARQAMNKHQYVAPG